MSDSWKLSYPCNRAQAEELTGEHPGLAALEPMPVLVATEEDEDADRWRIDAYFDSKPPRVAVQALGRLLGIRADRLPQPEKLDDTDWVTMSQDGLAPVSTRRFHIHSGEDAGPAADGARVFRIDAGRAFGTGHHQTTTGCLTMLETLRERGARFDDVLDIGTGTGILAFAALHLWPYARTLASDIDPVSVEVSAANAEQNGVRIGRGRGRLALVAAAGTDHALIAHRAPYDLVIANILAGPLIELAPGIARITAEGGTLIVAGLLDRQAGDVAAVYRRQGFRLADRIDRGDWPCLRFVKRARFAPERVRRREGRGEAPGFGSW
ncbi:50S ribosomal protein L11 methyltransferase [Sphingomonas sp.]